MPSSIESLRFFKSRSNFRGFSAGVFGLVLAVSPIGLPEAAVSPAAAVVLPSYCPTATRKATTSVALKLLNCLPVKGRAPKTGYDRNLFSDGWGERDGCDLRNYILRRDLTEITYRPSPACTIASGVLKDPYTAKTIYFVRGTSTSWKVQIDHVVAVSDAWQKGAQSFSYSKKNSFYNDPLNLLAVDGPTNSAKSDSDAASWMPPSKSYRCKYVGRQVAVKLKYGLWVTQAEKAKIASVLTSTDSCKKHRIANTLW